MENSHFEYLIIKDSSWTLHENNVHTILIEIYRSLHHISPPKIQVTPYSL